MSEPETGEFYGRLSFTDKKEYIRRIETAKKDETRLKRLKEFIDKLKLNKKLNDK